MSMSVISIDVSNIKKAEELHLLLKEKLEFPDFYGENWNAFWDAITGLVELPDKLELIGWTILQKKLPYDATLMKECLIDYNKQAYEKKCEFIFN
ncbi:barnase inhibitor [Bacillus pseudomycoides]|uniref:barstar family protein n=1 Tax=Bacillus pseudomycoides TaxID=64104 RepID=UPI0002D4B332|nr:barstar family protein [Bacillus pseudomycoides]PDZ72505.1 barnase inhibitor [Bacillus pseudomycoides]PEJ23432.1 barnase inhibitor [Bacillus pseudomycoides]PEM41748.1 barnase inhibitor [Bacillus pseudomycoides]